MIEENVVWLDVEVQDLHVASAVEVMDASGHAQGNLLELLQTKASTAAFPISIGGENILVERSVGHELVDQRPLRSVRAKPEKPHDVQVVDASDGGHLVDEIFAVEVGSAQELNGDRVCSHDVALEDGAEAALA